MQYLHRSVVIKAVGLIPEVSMDRIILLTASATNSVL